MNLDDSKQTSLFPSHFLLLFFLNFFNLTLCFLLSFVSHSFKSLPCGSPVTLPRLLEVPRRPWNPGRACVTPSTHRHQLRPPPPCGQLYREDYRTCKTIVPSQNSRTLKKNIVPGRETIPGGVKYLLCLLVYYPASRQGVFMESRVCVCVIPTESLATSPCMAATGCLRGW